MKESKKYFGMTPTQIAILAGLAAIACLIFGSAGWLTLRGKSGFLTSPPQTALIPKATVTPFVIPTLTPTETPTQIPYEQRIPIGWKQFKTSLVEVWLPSTFELMDPAEFMADAHSKAKELGLKASSGSIFGDLGAFELILFYDTERVNFSNLIVYITYEPLIAMSLDDAVDAQISRLPVEYAIVEKRKVRLDNYDGIRVVAEIKIQLLQANQLVYVIQDGSTVWQVAYTTKLEEFYTQLPVFEDSIQTFRIVR